MLRVSNLVVLSAFAAVLWGCAPSKALQETSSLHSDIDNAILEIFGSPVLDGPAHDRALEIFSQVVDTADPDRKLYLRVLRHDSPQAYSNGGAKAYVTTGTVLRANDAQLFMILAHELAHLEAKKLDISQDKRSVIRKAELVRSLTDRTNDGLTNTRSRTDCSRDGFLPPRATVEAANPIALAIWGVVATANGIICSDVLKAAPSGLNSVFGARRSDALQAFLALESEMDAIAFRLGQKAGYDPAELVSAFHLLNTGSHMHPFLRDRAMRLGFGDQRGIPIGTAPVELGDRLAASAVDQLHTIGRLDHVLARDRIRRIRDFAEATRTIYGSVPAFQRAYFSYLIAYGGDIGIDPAWLREAMTGLDALGSGSVGNDGVIGRVWMGCRRVALQPAFRDALASFASVDNAKLNRVLAEVVRNPRFVQEDRECDLQS
ncbi:MAG: M48 family metalloprotease [Pseudomonadota bacterium]